MLAALGYIVVGVLVGGLGVLAYASTRPDTFAVRRSRTIRAPAERIFPLISDLRRMNTWNPFLEPDPAIELAYSGPESGKGAAHTWKGNRNVGEGSFEITEAVAPTLVTGRLRMRKPMAADNLVEFRLEPEGHATTVTWLMSGRQPLIGKLMTLFIDCDRMVGGQFEKGLAALDAKAMQPRSTS